MSDIYIVKVKESRPATAQKPSAGPVYRSIYAKDGLLELPAGLESPWQFLRFVVYIILLYAFMYSLLRIRLLIAIACVYIVGSILCVFIGLEKSVLREMASKASNSLTSISDVL